MAGLLMLPAVPAWWLPAPLLDWQPALAGHEPWRWFSAAWVHWSESHLLANLAAAAVVGAYGWAAGLPRSQALAWLAAWPLTQLGLLIKPDLLHYGGLSGVLHAGVAITSLWLLVVARGGRRLVGAAVMLGLVIKLMTESPWGPALQRSAEFDIALAPVAHASGALAGLVCGALALLLRR
jgi:rhomboid family GlyGly-CTERM serine protease